MPIFFVVIENLDLDGIAGVITMVIGVGDEWKGDIARMMMYMYLRYPNQCPATDVGGDIFFFTSRRFARYFFNVEC